MNHLTPKTIMLAVVVFLLSPLARAGTFDLAPDLSAPARIITLGEPPPSANPRWIQLRMDFDTLLPEGLLGWRDYSFRTEENGMMGPVRIDIYAPGPKHASSSGNGQFNFNIGYQF